MGFWILESPNLYLSELMMSAEYMDWLHVGLQYLFDLVCETLMDMEEEEAGDAGKSHTRAHDWPDARSRSATGNMVLKYNIIIKNKFPIVLKNFLDASSLQELMPYQHGITPTDRIQYGTQNQIHNCMYKKIVK